MLAWRPWPWSIVLCLRCCLRGNSRLVNAHPAPLFYRCSFTFISDGIVYCRWINLSMNLDCAFRDNINSGLKNPRRKKFKNLLSKQICKWCTVCYFCSFSVYQEAGDSKTLTHSVSDESTDDLKVGLID